MEMRIDLQHPDPDISLIGCVQKKKGRPWKTWPACAAIRWPGWISLL